MKTIKITHNTPKTRAYIEVYTSIYEFETTINNRPNTNTNIFTTETSKSETFHIQKFTGTTSYSEATDLLRKGVTQYMQNLKKLTIQKPGSNTTRQKMTTHTHGFRPNVPAYLSGSPLSMLHIEKRRTAPPVITLVVDMSFPYSVSQENIMQYGANIINAIYILESSGIKTNLYISSLATDKHKNRMITPIIQIKKATQTLNLAAISYPLHPSFLRRHCFRWMETIPVKLTKDFKLYGIANQYSTNQEQTNAIITQAIGPGTIFIDHTVITTQTTTEQTLDYILKQNNKQQKQTA